MFGGLFKRIRFSPQSIVSDAAAADDESSETSSDDQSPPPPPPVVAVVGSKRDRNGAERARKTTTTSDGAVTDASRSMSYDGMAISKSHWPSEDSLQAISEQNESVRDAIRMICLCARDMFFPKFLPTECKIYQGNYQSAKNVVFSFSYDDKTALQLHVIMEKFAALRAPVDIKRLDNMLIHVGNSQKLKFIFVYYLNPGECTALGSVLSKIAAAAAAAQT